MPSVRIVVIDLATQLEWRGSMECGLRCRDVGQPAVVASRARPTRGKSDGRGPLMAHPLFSPYKTFLLLSTPADPAHPALQL